ncbi:MAG TPA: hypothetical protein VF021_03830 [Longimicrobiales bacterium]
MACNDLSPRMYQAQAGSTLSIRVATDGHALVCRGRIMTDSAEGTRQEQLTHDELLQGVERVVDDHNFTVVFEVRVDFFSEAAEAAQVIAELDPAGAPPTNFCKEVRGRRGTTTKVATVGAMI